MSNHDEVIDALVLIGVTWNEDAGKIIVRDTNARHIEWLYGKCEPIAKNHEDSRDIVVPQSTEKLYLHIEPTSHYRQRLENWYDEDGDLTIPRDFELTQLVGEALFRFNLVEFETDEGLRGELHLPLLNEIGTQIVRLDTKDYANYIEAFNLESIDSHSRLQIA